MKAQNEQMTMPLGTPEDILKTALELKRARKMETADALKAAMTEHGRTAEKDFDMYADLLFKMGPADKGMKNQARPPRGIETEDKY